MSQNANFGAQIINDPDWIRYVNQLSGWEIFWWTVGVLLCIILIIVSIIYLVQCCRKKKTDDEAAAILYGNISSGARALGSTSSS